MVPDEATRLSARRPTAMPRSAMFGGVAISRPTIARFVVTSFHVMLNGGVYLSDLPAPCRGFLWSSYCAARHARSVRVLIAEDELRLADAIARGLRRQGMAVDLAPDGEQALVKARVVRYDVLVLDRDLPGRARRRRVPHGARRAPGDRDPDAHRRRRARGRGRGPVAGRRRLPGQAVSLRRAGRAHPCAGAAHRAEPAAGAAATATSSSTRRAAGSPAAGSELELARKEFAVLEALMARRRRYGVGRAAARARLGRAHRPVHQRGANDDHDAAPQAGRPAGGARR